VREVSTVRGFGDLEAAIMTVMWARDQPATVRDVHAELGPDRQIAYTTVMTVMDTLHRKGFLARQMIGRAWSYRPTASRQEYTAQVMREVLASAGDQTGVLGHFIASLSEPEATALRALLRRRRNTGRQ